MKRFAFVADVPGWAFDRTGRALARYSKEPGWDVLYVNPYTIPTDGFAQYAAVRVGGVPLFMDLVKRGLVNERKFFPTIASFVDMEWHGKALATQRSNIAAVIINDQRFRPDALALDRPVIYTPDKVDSYIFRPDPKVRQPGRVRVGWAGSEKWWGDAKRVADLRAIVERVGGRFILQDREQHGAKTAVEMACWLNNEVDIYATANIERTCTPVTVIEAIACCCPVVTTRCGELDGLLSPHVLCSTLEQLEQTLKVFVTQPEAFAALQAEAVALLPRWYRFLTWEGSNEAQNTTAAMVALMKALGGVE